MLKSVRRVLFLLILAGVCTHILLAFPASPSPLQVAAAADLQPVLPTLVAMVQAETARAVSVSYGSSATLATQIENGAPFDVFLSADMSFPEKLVKDGFAASDTPIPYARGTLVLWTRRDSPLRSLSIESLRDAKLQSLAIANPEHAPYGRAAVASLQAMHLYEMLAPKLRIAENIAQAAQFAESGNADAGLLSLTAASTSRFRSEGRYIEVPASSYPAIVQGAVVLRHAADRAAAEQWMHFLLSPRVRKEMEARGLKPPSP